MKKRMFVASMAAAAALLASGCSTTGRGASADPSVERASIAASVDAAMNRLSNQIPSSRPLVEKARGIAVFPSVLSAGLGVGGSYGEGALMVDGRIVDYYETISGSVGLLAGAESKALYLLFMDDASLERFRSKPNWTVGADASVTVLDVGATAAVDTKTAQRQVIGYALTNKGLMANLSLDGTRFAKKRF
ncbi:MAG: YSC84-related protein [Lautropia sp.]